MRLLILLAVALGQVTAPTAARDMRLTIYDDGLSCPGGCDAHVVLNPKDNGTRYAFRPDSTRARPAACVNGQMCRICLNEADASCMTVRYRGGGPSAGTIDATPAFYAANCGQQAIPAPLARQCAALDAAVERSGYRDRIDCLAPPANARCATILSTARSAAAADAPKLAQCRSLGEARFNARQTDPRERRANDCLYSDMRLGGPNAHGLRWRRLLPGACRPGSFVGRDGLDCCSADLRFAAHAAPECAAFFVPPR